MSTRSLPGFFTIKDNGAGALSAVAVDAATSPEANIAPPYLAIPTLGVSRISQLSVQPGTSGKWSIVGFTAQLRLAIGGVNLSDPPRFILFKPGSVWLGLVQDASIADTNWAGGPYFPDRFSGQPPASPSLPTDLSTFTEIWNPNTGPDLRFFPNAASASPTPEQCTLVAQTVAFPLPLVAQPGSRLFMALIVTSSITSSADIPFATPATAPIIATSNLFTYLFVRSCTYNILYEE